MLRSWLLSRHRMYKKKSDTMPATKPSKISTKRFTYTRRAPEPESEEEPSVEEVATDPLEGVDDVDEVQDIAQDIFDKHYKEFRRAHAKTDSRYPDKTHIYIKLLNEETGKKEWVPLVYGKGNRASDMALQKVKEALEAHDFKVDYRAETKA